MNISVLGCGRWASFLAWYLSRQYKTAVWGRPGSEHFQRLKQTRTNDYVTLSEQVLLLCDLPQAVARADLIVISISAQQLRELSRQLAKLPMKGKTVVLCMKGLECDSGKRLTQVLHEEIDADFSSAVWVGPGHVQDFTKQIPNCMVVDSQSAAVTDYVVEAFSSELIRLYKGTDLLGTEIGAAAKNVIGIAAGMLDGIGCTSLKGALMARGAREVARLIRAMGGSELSAYGLCHLGDYEATLFSPHSHNRRFGESYMTGTPCRALAEGVPTAKAMIALGRQYQVELPICQTVYEIVYEQCNGTEKLRALFSRSVKSEFEQ